ncbi:hypothetical protein FD725_25110 [Nostoc sp. TCL26-01]|nr:hypothetical protein FD725_25110 [Nostoc sp. TCL26-01]
MSLVELFRLWVLLLNFAVVMQLFCLLTQTQVQFRLIPQELHFDLAGETTTQKHEKIASTKKPTGAAKLNQSLQQTITQVDLYVAARL